MNVRRQAPLDDIQTQVEARKELARTGGTVLGIAASIGTVFMTALGGENVPLTDTVGCRFIDNAETLHEYVEGTLRVLGRE